MKAITKQSVTRLCLPALLSLALTGCVQQGMGGGLLPPTGTHVYKLAGPAAAPPPPPLAPAAANTLRFWRDYSKSVDEETLAKIVGELAGALLRHKEEIVGVEVVRFANGTNSVWAEMPVKFIWGPAPEIAEFRPDLDKAPPEARLFKDAMKKYVEGERRRYDEANALLLTGYKARVEEQLERFTEYLLQRPAVVAPCTQFATLAERMRMEDLPHSVLITDGWADCPDEKRRAPAGVELRGRHVVIQLTRHMDSQADEEDFLQRKTFLNKLFPTSEVVHASVPDQAIEFIFR